MQIFYQNGFWRLLKNGHLPVKLHSSTPPGSNTILGTFYRDSLRAQRLQTLITLLFDDRWVSNQGCTWLIILDLPNSENSRLGRTRRWESKQIRIRKRIVVLQPRKMENMAPIVDLLWRRPLKWPGFIKDFCKSAKPSPQGGRRFRTTAKSTVFRIDDYAKDGGPGRSDLHVVFTMTLCGTNFCIWQDIKLIFTS